MFNDHPESGEALVVTGPGKEVSVHELGRAFEISTLRYFGARQICPKAGECALTLCYEVMEGTDSCNRVDVCYIDCDNDCALLIGQDYQLVGQDDQSR